MTGSGSGSGPNGTTLVQIYITSSWNIDANGNSIAGTNSNIWNAVVGYHDANVNMNGATEMWNNATSNGNHINHYFQVNQSIFSHTDIFIFRGNPEGGCADIKFDSANGVWVMRVSDAVKNLSHDWIAAIIAHEIGHALGLTNSENEDCINSIMQGHLPGGCEPIVKAINAQDVDAARKHATDRLHCDVQSQPTVIPNPEQTPGGGGGGLICQYDDTGCEDCVPDDGLAWQNCRNLEAQWFGNPYCRCSDASPILVDVLGNGFALTNRAGGVMFDLNNDGTKNQIPWTTALTDDGWLCLDRDGNGTIDGGSELFGNYTLQPEPPAGEERNGFLALAEFDKTPHGGNGDGLITEADTVFSSLRLWQDVNHNGFSEPAELLRLETVRINVLELEYKTSKHTDQFGNQFRYRAKVKDTNDAKTGRWAWDVFLFSR
jgi:hypothetical protein